MNPDFKNPMLRISEQIESEIKYHNLRKRKEVENLRISFIRQIPSTVTVEIDLSQIGERDKISFFSDSILDILCFALSRSYKKYPKVNSTYIDEKSYMEFSQMDIGIAFDDSSNLKVLALKNPALLSLPEIQEEIIKLLELYSSGNTIPMEYFNSTITVTDLSRIGVTQCVPVLSMGQAVIIGITRPKPGSFFLNCTYDHQILEGKYISDFLNLLSKQILSIYESISSNADLSCSACGKSVNEELEISPQNRGLIVLRKSNLEEILLCRVCFEGY